MYPLRLRPTTTTTCGQYMKARRRWCVLIAAFESGAGARACACVLYGHNYLVQCARIPRRAPCVLLCVVVQLAAVRRMHGGAVKFETKYVWFIHSSIFIMCGVHAAKIAASTRTAKLIYTKRMSNNDMRQHSIESVCLGCTY